MAVRMRFPQQAVDELRKADPDTQVTTNFVRKLLAEGKVPFIYVGRRRLLNYDILLEYLNTGHTGQKNLIVSGTIRPIL